MNNNNLEERKRLLIEEVLLIEDESVLIQMEEALKELFLSEEGQIPIIDKMRDD